MRHLEIFNPYEFHIPIHIIGAGATGSFTACALSKLGIKEIHVYDYDIIEEHNFYNQYYTRDKVGMYKVEALAEMLDNIIPHKKEVTSDDTRYMEGIVLIMVDSMKVRKELFEGLKNDAYLFRMIDARMGADTFTIYEYQHFNIDTKKMYEKSLYSDDDAETTTCGEVLSVVGTAMAIGSWISWRIINLHAGKSSVGAYAGSLSYENFMTMNKSEVV